MVEQRRIDRRIVDTNVLATANRHHAGVPADCIAECATRLQEIMTNGQIVIDDGWRILGQYRTNVSGPGPGHAFLEWLYQNTANQERCTQVAITPKPGDKDDFHEVPSPLDLPEGDQIDPSDRMFLAVSAAHPDRPPIVQATDSKWIGWESALEAHAIEVEWVCREYVQTMYEKKMPGRMHKNRSGNKHKGTRRHRKASR